MKNQFWNLIIWAAGRLADTGWFVTLCGDGLMETGRRVGFSALERLAESEVTN